METFETIVAGLAFVVLLFIALYYFFSILDFFIEVPKQLKRIADALEKRCKNG